MRNVNLLTRLAIAGALVALVVGCKYEAPIPFEEGEWLGGEWVEPETLTRGQDAYILYCYACHGEEGDGKGPASSGLRPPPRDFRVTTYKFGRALDGLPHDEDLIALVRNGLEGTAMLPWDIPDTTMNDIIQYIKTFSAEDEGWWDEDAELGEQVLAGEDPWAEEGRDAAVARGKAVYHAYQCWSCHPSYASKADMAAATKEIKGQDLTNFRDNLFLGEAKLSEFYTVPITDAPECEADDECGEGNKCVYGTCEHKMRIAPPDFTMDAIRMGTDVGEIYRTVAAGIPGSGMPQWKGSVDDSDIWAVAHYVNWLAGWKNTPQAIEMKQKLRAGSK